MTTAAILQKLAAVRSYLTAASSSLGQAIVSIDDLAKLLSADLTKHARCGALHAANGQTGIQAFVANTSYYDCVHPVWYAVNTDGVGVRALASEADPTVLTAAKGAGVRVWPTVAADPGVPAIVRAMMSDAAKRAAHIALLVKLVAAKDYVGLDLDYEHLSQLGDKALFTAFAYEATAAFHAVGKKLSVCVQGLSHPVAENWADYLALAGIVDAIHVMAYDYHPGWQNHAGPVSPTGWVDQIGAHIASTGHPEKFILGLPNYGCTIGWPGPQTALADCVTAAGANYAVISSHMASCSYNDGTPKILDTREPNAHHVTYGDFYFDDALSLEEKVKIARDRGLAGIYHWTIGGEPPGFFDMVRRYYPA